MQADTRRLMLLTTLIVVVLVLLLGMLAFLWPAASAQHVDVGQADDFALGTVTSFRIAEGRAFPVTEAPRQQVSPTYGVHIVRLDDGGWRAFSWASPHVRWAAQWHPDLEVAQVEGLVGAFDDGFSLWRMDGTLIVGPAPRGLDQFFVEVTDNGRVVLDLSHRIEGDQPE